MKATFLKKLKRLIAWLFLLFIVLFIFRLIYGYSFKFDEVPGQMQIFDNISNTRKNYASKKYNYQSGADSQAAVNVDQKYEKIAEIRTKSSDFKQEEELARNKIEEFNGIIQFEQKSGNDGYRKLNLVVGVPPENFDVLYNQLIEIGKIQAKQITKKDKTNEYKELNSRKRSLEKIRTSLIELKSKGGKIEEYMELENRILEIEQDLQDLGVSLGDFDDENEFCTVQFSLVEGKDVKIGILQRIKVALEWTVKIYLRLMATFFFLTLFAYLALLIVEKSGVIGRMLNKSQD